VTAGARLRVDPIACDGRGLCAEVLPELITLDDWGYPIIADGEIPSPLMAGAEEAIRLCPLLALHLDRSRSERPRHATTKGPA
jgi:ferredoxin